MLRLSEHSPLRVAFGNLFQLLWSLWLCIDRFGGESRALVELLLGEGFFGVCFMEVVVGWGVAFLGLQTRMSVTPCNTL